MSTPSRLNMRDPRILALAAVGIIIVGGLLIFLIVRSVTEDGEERKGALRRAEQRLSPPKIRTSAKTPKLRRVKAKPPPDPDIAIPAADRTPAKVWTELKQEAREDGRVSVIVILKGAVEAEGDLQGSEIRQQRAEIDQKQDALLEELGGKKATDVDRLQALPIIAMDVTPAGLAELKSSPLVAGVEEDVPQPVPEPRPDVARPGASQSAAAVQLDDWWDLPQSGIYTAWQNGFDGRNRIVAVLDTGVQSDHPWLQGKVLNEACFSSNSNCPNGQQRQYGAGAAAPCNYAPQNCGHGTHVAHTAAGIYGVARRAGVVAVQVFSRFTGNDCRTNETVCARTWPRDQLLGLDHIVRLARANPRRVAAVNLSLGGGRFTSYCDEQQTGSFQWYALVLRSYGVATVVSAGNEGYTDAIGRPACNSAAFSVGATTLDDAGADAVATDFSNSAPILSILAPGVHICSAIPGSARDCWQGTSMAAPHIAGAFASLAQLQLDVMRWPYISVPHAFAALRNSADPVRDPRNGIVRGRLQVWDALVTLYNTR